MSGAGAHGLIEMHHLGDGVGAEDFVDTIGLDGNDTAAVFDQHGGDVREVVLSVSIVSGEQVELAEEGFGFEAVDARVDFGRVQLIGPERFLLDDGIDVRLVRQGYAGRGRSRGGSDQDGGEDGHCGVLAEVQIAEGGDASPDEWAGRLRRARGGALGMAVFGVAFKPCSQNLLDERGPFRAGSAW